MYAVSFLSATTGFTAGAVGSINRTTDGGETWTPLASGTFLDLYDISFTDALTGTVVGRGGTILRTTNGGNNWFKQVSGTTQWLKGVSFSSTQLGTAVGINGTIIRTTNGGALWHAQTAGTPTHLNAVSFADGLNGIAVGNGGTVLTTTDGGSTWEPETSGTSSVLSAVSYVDAQTAVAVGAGGLILRTTDGGTTWTLQPSGTTDDLYAVDLRGDGSGMATGKWGLVLRTTDGGASWVDRSTGVYEHIWDVSAPEGDLAWAVGRYGTLLQSTNAGVDWESQTRGTRKTLHRVQFMTSEFGVAVGVEGLILRTTDGGESWEELGSGTTQPLYGLHLQNTSRGTVVGGGGTILETTDGGDTWAMRVTDAVAGDIALRGVDYPTPDTGYIVGDQVSWLLTTNGGLVWELKFSWTPTGIQQAVKFFTSLEGVAAGESDLIQYTTDGGKLWDYRPPNEIGEFDINGMTAPTPTHWIVVRARGEISRTTDKGITWYPTMRWSPHSLYGVSFTDVNTGTAVGGRGTIIRTTNGGTSWTPEVSGVDTILRDVYFTEPTRGWAVGMGGTIIHTGPSGPDDPGATFSVITGWNLVSVPVAVEDYSVGAVFPLASGNAHGYDDGYVSTETLEGGRGYWLKFASGGTISVLGDPVAAETVAVNEEWNMVGSVSSAVDVTSIGSEPPGIVTSAFYYFDGAYQQSTVIEPGRGYWVKASQAGELIMGPAGAVPSSSRIRIEDKGERPPGPPGGDVGAGGPGETPVSFYLAQNSPNPFNSSTTIRFAVPARGRVSLTVYDVLGRPAATLVDGELSPGEHEVRWEAGDLPSGVYLCRIEAGSDMAVTKVLLLK